MTGVWRALPWMAVAGAIAAYYRFTVLGQGEFGLPLDDPYIHLTYARQIARGRPFTSFDGSGYTAGATSALQPEEGR